VAHSHPSPDTDNAEKNHFLGGNHPAGKKSAATVATVGAGRAGRQTGRFGRGIVAATITATASRLEPICASSVSTHRHTCALTS